MERRRRRVGYSLIEILMAVFVLAVALLGTVAALHYSVRGSLHGSLYTEASSHARAIMEVMLSENRAFLSASLPAATSGINDAAGVTRPLNEAPFAQTEYRFPNLSRFRRSIWVQEVRSLNDSVAARAWRSDLRQITVTVYWNEASRQRSVQLVSFSRRHR